ncbi:MAG: insulinase family protein [Alphaproteobacteria bacterium]|nr:insulinase family protein [Alphaproteobacteria bacterium]
MSKKILANGLTVMYRGCSRESIGNFAGCLSVNVGHVNEPKLGIASLFEKTLLLQTTDILPVFGGTMTAYTAVGTSLDQVVTRLSRVFNQTVVTDEFVQKAKQRIADETKRTAFQIMRRMKLLYKHTAFGADLVRPTEEFLAKLDSYTTEEVREFANTYYTGKNVVLVLSGTRVSLEQVVKIAEKELSNVPAGEKQKEFVGDFYTGGFGKIDVYDDVTRLMFGWDMSAFTVDDSPTMNVMMSLLLCQLEWDFARRIPDAQVEVKIAGYYGARTLRVYVSSPTASARKMTQIFAEEINKICDDWISPETLERVRSAAMIEKLDKYEKSDNAALEVAWQLIGRGNMYDVSNRISAIGMTTDEDVRALAERVFRGSRVTYIVAASPDDNVYSYAELLKALHSDFLLNDNDE